jgi:hypothetical protein
MPNNTTQPSTRFPSDFVFQLLPGEIADLRPKFVTAGTQDPARQYDGALRSQFVTSKTGRGQHREYPPYAFTKSVRIRGPILQPLARSL